ncbi:MAG: T9SS type A sorting domain-containing protein [Saprospiraceae bacterium]
MPASIVQGVECKLVYDGGLLLLPCAAPIGFYALPVGTQLLISFVPDTCISFCQQGFGADIQCAQVVGGTNITLCAGQSVNIGTSTEPNRHYQWEPVDYLSCDTCAIATVNPPGNAIYSRTETIPPCLSCQPVTTYYNIAVSPCTGTGEAPLASVVLSPVPTSGVLQVTGLIFERFRVFDTQGQLRMERRGSEDQTIDLSALPAAMYYLQMTSKDGQVLRKVTKVL